MSNLPLPSPCACLPPGLWMLPLPTSAHVTPPPPPRSPSKAGGSRVLASLRGPNHPARRAPHCPPTRPAFRPKSLSIHRAPEAAWRECCSTTKTAVPAATQATPLSTRATKVIFRYPKICPLLPAIGRTGRRRPVLELAMAPGRRAGSWACHWASS